MRSTRFFIFLPVACLILTAPAPVAAQAIEGCPIQIKTIDPHAAFYSGDDPWGSYLRIDYVNTSSKKIVAIRFGVAFVDALAESKESVYSYTSDTGLNPGKTTKGLWGDGVYFNQYGSKMGAIVWIEKLRFADDTFFEDAAKRTCSWKAVTKTR